MSTNPTNLYQLREKLAAEILEQMLRGEPFTDKNGDLILIDGKPVYKRPNAATLNVARQFLKDNGIDKDPIETPTGDPLVKSLPFQEEQNQIAHLDGSAEDQF